MEKRRLWAATATLPLVTAGLVAGTPSAAQADCGHSWSNKDADSGNVVWISPTPRMRTGPHGHCDSVSVLSGGTKLYYHCYVVNEAGNTWTHARRAGTNIQGWVWDEVLSDYGSVVRC